MYTIYLSIYLSCAYTALAGNPNFYYYSAVPHPTFHNFHHAQAPHLTPNFYTAHSFEPHGFQSFSHQAPGYTPSYIQTTHPIIPAFTRSYQEPQVNPHFYRGNNFHNNYHGNAASRADYRGYAYQTEDARGAKAKVVFINGANNEDLGTILPQSNINLPIPQNPITQTIPENPPQHNITSYHTIASDSIDKNAIATTEDNKLSSTALPPTTPALSTLFQSYFSNPQPAFQNIYSLNNQFFARPHNTVLPHGTPPLFPALQPILPVLANNFPHILNQNTTENNSNEIVNTTPAATTISEAVTTISETTQTESELVGAVTADLDKPEKLIKEIDLPAEIETNLNEATATETSMTENESLVNTVTPAIQISSNTSEVSESNKEAIPTENSTIDIKLAIEENTKQATSASSVEVETTK